MILRQFRVTIHRGKEDEFEKVFRDEILPMVKAHDGLEWVAAGKPYNGAPNVFCMTMLWRDLDALKGFAGNEWNTARIEPEEAHLIEATELEHFGLLGTTGP
ncbi:antibiotic biosynthesis monooxygenase family protein [Tsuneonella mangrovi]|uniref:antibiotic biosynthesis monooxygenase family protein n=1 Tax=Tsuneonella mangrovi TaxID=1982042 RepID=UPI000BA25D9E|nr:antibiotic biosynthesis monooxygenase [Tsuneonella mangrovi]